MIASSTAETYLPSAAELKKAADMVHKERVTEKLVPGIASPNYIDCKNAFEDAIRQAFAKRTNTCEIYDRSMVLNQLACIELQLNGYVFTNCGFRRVHKWEQRTLRYMPFIRYRAKVEVGKLYTIKFRPRHENEKLQYADLDFDEKWNPN